MPRLLCLSLLILHTAFAVDYSYRAGVGSSPQSRAVVIQDRAGKLAIFAEADFMVTRAVSDFVAAQLLDSIEFERSSLIVVGRGEHSAASGPLISSISAALNNLAHARISFTSGRLSIRTEKGDCLAVLFPIAFQGCESGAPVPSGIRSSFQFVEVRRGLLKRNELNQVYPVQAIGLGKLVTILALGGDATVDRFRAPRRMVVPFANDAAPFPDDPAVEAAISRALARVQ
jgi:hypothetical protein